MEYGVFAERSLNLSLLWLALFFAIAGGILLIARSALKALSNHSRNISLRKEAIFGGRAGGGYNEPSLTVFIVFGVLFFVAAFVLSIVGVAYGCCQDNSNSKYAGQGAYNVVWASLVYHARCVVDKDNYCIKDENGKYIYKPTEPDYFELKLEGRADKSYPDSLLISRVVDIPYERISENYKYAPAFVPEIKIPITTPKYIINYGNNWWQFADALPSGKKSGKGE